MGRLLD